MGYLDPNRALPALLGHGLDAIIDKRRFGATPVAPTARERTGRYQDALCLAGEAPEHGKREVHGAELQANLRAYGTTIDLLLLAQAMYRQDQAQQARGRKIGTAVIKFRGRQHRGDAGG